MGHRYRFEGFELDTAERQLWHEGEVVGLQDLPLRLLSALVEAAPALVSRDELRRELWPPGTHLDVDASLNTAVARIRDALGDEASSPRFVETVPRRGYRFVGELLPVGKDCTAWARNLGSAAAIILLLVAGIWFRSWAGSSDSSKDKRSPSVAAEQLLIARHHADRRSKEGLEKAIASYQSAAALDPESAEAYGGLATAYALLGIYDYWRPLDAFEPAETMARRALELDPGSAEGHMALGLVAAIAKWDWESADRSMKKAIVSSPDHPEILFWRGAFLATQGEFEQSIAATRRALASDPTSSAYNAVLAWRLFQARRFDEAIEQARHAIDIDATSYDAWDNLKWIHLTAGNESAGADAWARAEEIASGSGDELRAIFASAGVRGLHETSIQSKLERLDRVSYESPYDLVLDYTAIGERARALDWLERSLAERETDLLDLAVDPRVDPLREDPRFQAVLDVLGFPQR